MNAARELHNQVMWNRLISIVEEQALTLVRTAFSTSVREAGDLSAGVFDTEGRMIAQAVTGTPGHVNTMAAAVGHFIDDIGPERIYPGDVYITNDPWKGTGHLHDITVTTPVFRDPSDDTSLVGFFRIDRARRRRRGSRLRPRGPRGLRGRRADPDPEVGRARRTQRRPRHHGALERPRIRSGHRRHPRPRGM